MSFQSTPDDPVIKRVETVGRVMPHVRAKLVDPVGRIVPVGTPGELLVSGYLLQKGYWNDEVQTEQVMKRDEEGTLWMHTGDEGIMDEEGYLRSSSQSALITVRVMRADVRVAVVGRIKDIIIRGGEVSSGHFHVHACGQQAQAVAPGVVASAIPITATRTSSPFRSRTC